jgi:predicted Ser/Thr protein kinase
MRDSPPLDPLFLSFQTAVAGRYSLDRELGRGGMGIVYLAREVHLDRLVAIKLLPPQRAADSSLRERFLREARLAAKLSHPNIIPIHSVEDVGGFVFYVMAFIDGETLAERVRSRGPLPSGEGARVLREAAWALAYAHAQGIVHRDVKPDNILLEGETARVLVADFGIAAALGAASADGISGTPEFMSPEQALGKPLDARSDLYGLGATAFYAFSGRCPFEGANATEVLAKQVTEPAPPLASAGTAVPRKLAALVDRCLAKDPEQRPVSAQALAEQLAIAIERKRELPTALRAFVKRNGRLDGGGTLIGGMLLLPGSVIVSAMFGGAAGFAALFVGGAAVPFAYLVRAARKLSLMGFSHQDLAPAFEAEIEQNREELSIARAVVRASWLEDALKSAARVSAVVGVAGFSMIFLDAMPRIRFIGDAMAPMALGLAFMFGVGRLALRQQNHDIDSEFWARVWTGRLGKAMFAAARRMLGGRSPITAMTHRATELSLGMAAEQLFESLPKATRAALGELPSVLHRLQADAQALRRRYDDLQDALAAAGDGAALPAYSDVRAARDEIHAKLGESVGALEMMRLDLLRLHAGSVSVQAFTTNLGLAVEVSEQVERIIAAHGEVERSLAFPRPIRLSPA